MDVPREFRRFRDPDYRTLYTGRSSCEVFRAESGLLQMGWMCDGCAAFEFALPPQIPRGKVCSLPRQQDSRRPYAPLVQRTGKMGSQVGFEGLRALEELRERLLVHTPLKLPVGPYNRASEDGGSMDEPSNLEMDKALDWTKE